MKYKYKIIYDIKKDMWNWRDAAHNNVAYGYNWRDNLRSEHDRQIFDKVSKLTKKNAEVILSGHLDFIYKINKTDIDRYIEYLNRVYSAKFDEAIDTLEELTRKKSYFNNYTVYVTTFPRSPYDSDEGSLYMQLNDGRPVAILMHESLHFQFHNYWGKDKNSPVLKLSKNDFHYLKESLTVILDNDLVPLIEIFDHGYPMHKDFREKLHKHWKQCHDFEKLVDYGLSTLAKSTR